MKQQFIRIKNIFVVCFFGIILASCSTDPDIDPTGTERLDKQLVEEVSSLPNEVVPLGYATLTSLEKVALWNKHIDTYIAKNSLSKDILAHIKKLQEFNTVDIFENPNDPAVKTRIADFQQKWFKEPLQDGSIPREVLFQVATLSGVGVMGANLGSLNSRVLAKNSEVGVKCNCIYDLGCQGWSANCMSETCSGASNTNCGIFGTSKCEGKCDGPLG